jgi:hypothetical protein
VNLCVRFIASSTNPEEIGMPKGEQKGNRESKTIAAAPSQKTAGWQPTFGSGKKK